MALHDDRGPTSPADRQPARPDVPLDATDERIIAALCEDGRLSMRALAERIGVSRASAYARVERLRAGGAIRRFTIEVDHKRLGLRVSALIVVTLEQHSWREALAALRALPEVAYCATTAADFDALLIVRATDVDAVRDVLVERLNDIPGVRRTRTTLILDEFFGSDSDLLQAATRSAPSTGQLSL